VSTFVSGRELSRRFYEEQVRSVLHMNYPGLPYSAALLGRGSEVLGFDDEMSRDHNWEPRVLLFLQEDDYARDGEAVERSLGDALPTRFAGYPTQFSLSTLRAYVKEHLDLDVDGRIEACDWLTLPEQRLRMVTAGAVYHDEVGLQVLRDRLAYYPHDVWLYLLIAAWWRVHPEANLMGRAGFVGDELGSGVIASQLVHDLMHLCFLLEKQYAPYSKWFGTAFSRLECASSLAPVLQGVLRADNWSERQDALAVAYQYVATLHDTLGITPPVQIEVQQMWNRPFTVPWGDFPGLLRAQIGDPAVLRIADQYPTGGIDQIREILWNPRSRRRLLRLFD
jgi:hypothetical protein